MEFFRVWFDHVSGFCLFVARRRIDLETHQPVDTKVQIEVRNFKRLSGRSVVRKNADEGAPRGFAPAFSRLPLRFQEDRARGAAFKAKRAATRRRRAPGALIAGFAALQLWPRQNGQDQALMKAFSRI